MSARALPNQTTNHANRRRAPGYNGGRGAVHAPGGRSMGERDGTSVITSVLLCRAGQARGCWRTARATYLLTITNAQVMRIVNNYGPGVTLGPEDLLDAGEVADLLGLSSRAAVSVYRNRYEDFPPPFVEKSSGKCILWLRRDIERWVQKHPRQQPLGDAP
jgi:predicted DNA-binding transcriptional regulator AlpA